MLQVAVLRQDPDRVKKKLAFKYFQETGLVDDIIALDDRRKKLQQDFDGTQSLVNTASREIGQMMAKGEKEAAEQKKAEVETWKARFEGEYNNSNIV